MTKRQMLLMMTGFNLLWLFALVIILSAIRPAQAQSPTVIAAGPFYETYSGADFSSYRDDFAITRGMYDVVRVGGYGIGVAGIHLPPGATITSLTNDTNNTNGSTELLLLECPIGGTDCTEKARAVQNTPNRAQATTSLTLGVDTLNKAYVLQINLPNDSKFYYARIGYTLPYSFTVNSLFLPNVNR